MFITSTLANDDTFKPWKSTLNPCLGILPQKDVQLLTVNIPKFDERGLDEWSLLRPWILWVKIGTETRGGAWRFGDMTFHMHQNRRF